MLAGFARSASMVVGLTVIGCSLDDGGRPSGRWNGAGDNPADSPGDGQETGGEEYGSTGIAGEGVGSTGFGPGPTPVSWFDCSPPWEPTFIGSPCASDEDCSFEGGFCLREDEGFPCGTCSQTCEDKCPDQAGAPGTACIEGASIDKGPGKLCVSKCDPDVLDSNGCRDGYSCQADGSRGVCIPTQKAEGPTTPCQTELQELGAVYIPFPHTPESPAGYPSLRCEIEDPVLLYGPINGVGLRFVGADDDAPVLLACGAARSLVRSAGVAQMLGADEIIHIGTYNCRTIAGTNRLSEHGRGQAIDIYGFTMTDGSEVTLLHDWEDGVANPVTEEGSMLREFSDTLWEMMLWNIILTPEYNNAHDNHFHVDITPGGNKYK